MNSTSKIIFCLVVGLVVLQLVKAAKVNCKECSKVTYAACLNETGFAVCFDGEKASTTHGICPEGQVCTEEKGICKPRETVKPLCGSCNSCLQVFSCKSRTQFEYCVNGVPTGIVGKCLDGEYCSVKNYVKNKNICVKSCLEEPTCYADEASEPTYVDVCNGKATLGFYENIFDSTCQTYVYCEKLNGEMNAVLYTCASGTYFSSSLKKCVANKPERCA